MRRAGAGLIVTAVLALAGCKSTDPKANEKAPAGLGAGRTKPSDGRDAKAAVAKGPTWLDDLDKLPGAGTGIPKGVGPTNPQDPNFDARTAAQDALGGRVLDPYGRAARDVYVSIEHLGAPGGPAPVGIYADPKGYFFATGFKPGVGYELTVTATTPDGKTLTGTVQTKVPNVTLSIQLQDDLPPRAGTGPAAAKAGEFIPPAGFAPITQPKPPGDAWSPAGPTTSAPPATIGGAPAAGGPLVPGPAAGPLVPPDDLTPSPAPRPARPENVADGPKDPFKPPVTSIPSPNVPPVTGVPSPTAPPVPSLPARPPVPPPAEAGGRSTIGTSTGRTDAHFTLLDTLERPWNSDATGPGAVVLVEFMTSSCVPCKRAVPILKDLQSRYGASGLQVVGVLCDDLSQKERAAAAAQYHQEQNLNYAVYVEPVRVGSVRDRFEVEAYPHAILLDSAGRTLWRGNPLTDRPKLEAAVKQNLAK